MEVILKNRILIAIFALLLASTAQADLYRSFEATYSTEDGTLAGSGYWAATGVTFVRKVWQETPTSPFHYYGDLSILGGKGDVSHINEEISLTADASNVLSLEVLSGTVGKTEFGFFTEAPGWDGTRNIFKLDDTTGLNLEYHFTSDREPMWGSWSAKDGQAGSMGLNTVYNTAFGMPAPAFSIWDCPSYRGHIPVMDTTTVVPVPSALLLGLIGIGCASARLRKPV